MNNIDKIESFSSRINSLRRRIDNKDYCTLYKYFFSCNKLNNQEKIVKNLKVSTIQFLCTTTTFCNSNYQSIIKQFNNDIGSLSSKEYNFYKLFQEIELLINKLKFYLEGDSVKEWDFYSVFFSYNELIDAIDDIRIFNSDKEIINESMSLYSTFFNNYSIKRKFFSHVKLERHRKRSLLVS